MEKKFTNMERLGLPGGPNEVFSYITGIFSTEGYRKDSPDVNNLFNIIDSSDISMKDVEFPVMGYDELGNSQLMMPGEEYKFPGNQVLEIPIANRGREVTIGGKTYNTASKEYRKLIESGKVNFCFKLSCIISLSSILSLAS